MIERGSNSGNCGKSKGKSSQSRGPRDCWYCGKLWNKKKGYYTRKKNEGDKPKGNKEANVVSKKFEGDALLLSLESLDDLWVLDSGASFHATPHRGYFLYYVQGNFGLVYLGRNEPYQIVGKGKNNRSHKKECKTPRFNMVHPIFGLCPPNNKSNIPLDIINEINSMRCSMK